MQSPLYGSSSFDFTQFVVPVVPVVDTSFVQAVPVVCRDDDHIKRPAKVWLKMGWLFGTAADWFSSTYVLDSHGDVEVRFKPPFQQRIRDAVMNDHECAYDESDVHWLNWPMDIRSVVDFIRQAPIDAEICVGPKFNYTSAVIDGRGTWLFQDGKTLPVQPQYTSLQRREVVFKRK